MAWITTKAEFRPTGISDVEWESMTPDDRKAKIELSGFSFYSDEIFCANETDRPDITRVYFKNGDAYNINMKPSEVDRLKIAAEKEKMIGFKN